MIHSLVVLPLIAIALSICSSGIPTRAQITGMVMIRPADPRSYDTRPEGLTVEVLSESGELLGQATTGKVGQYLLSLTGIETGDELRVRTKTAIDGLELTASKRVRVTDISFVGVPDLVLVDPSDGELSRNGSSWIDPDGNVEVVDPSGQLGKVWARALDPERDRAFFPGNYRDADGNKIISNGFLFVAAKDANGQQVTSLDEPLTVYFSIPPIHRYYLRDINPGNGLYEVPMYIYDEEQDTWVRRGKGLVVDASYEPVPESEEDLVTTDPDYGDLFVKFEANRFSMWNIGHLLPPCIQ